MAGTAGVLCAIGQAMIPYYTGLIIDYASITPDRHMFAVTTIKLLLVALACSLFVAVRGGLFTQAMARLNVRVRKRLFGSLMAQVRKIAEALGCEEKLRKRLAMKKGARLTD